MIVRIDVSKILLKGGGLPLHRGFCTVTYDSSAIRIGTVWRIATGGVTHPSQTTWQTRW